VYWAGNICSCGQTIFCKFHYQVYAESYGAFGHRPESCEDFCEVLEKCLNKDGVHVIDLAVDYSLNHSILNVLLKEKSCIL